MLREHLKPDQDADDAIFDDDLHAVYIDITNGKGGVGRFFTGALVQSSSSPLKQKLLEQNRSGKAEPLIKNGGFTDELDKVDYEIGDLPSVKSAVATFPWTDGFVSALLHNYKVFPALQAYATKNLPAGHKFIVSTTCNREKQMCTHYVPMLKTEKFLMGHPDTADYDGREEDGISVDISPSKLLKGLKKMIGMKEKVGGDEL